MAPVEIRCDVDKLADVIRAANARMIAIDGCDGVGKTFLAEQFRNILNFFVLDLDSFLNEQRGSFVKNLKLDELKKEMQSRDARREGLIISGVCMVKVLSRINVSADMLIYVKLSSKYNTPSKGSSTWTDRSLINDIKDAANNMSAECLPLWPLGEAGGACYGRSW